MKEDNMTLYVYMHLSNMVTFVCNPNSSMSCQQETSVIRVGDDLNTISPEDS